jgi:hypothetical protein
MLAVGVLACSVFVDTAGLTSDSAAPDADAAPTDGNGSDANVCSRDCRGAPCVAGECAVTVLASKQLSPLAIALDATRVYWTNYDPAVGSVKACDKTGCNDTPDVIADNQSGPSAILIAEDRAFWSNVDGSQIQCRPLAADAGPPTALAGASYALAYAGHVLYFTDKQPAPRALVTGSAAGYWLSESTLRSSTFAMYPSTPATDLVTNQPSAHAIAVDAFSIFWTNESGTVMTAPIDSPSHAPTTLASGLSRPWAIAALGSDVYFTTIGADGAMIASVPKTGGPVTVIASHRKRPTSLAVDEQYLYWVDQEAGTVERAPR